MHKKVHLLTKVARKNREALLNMTSIIGCLWYNIAKKFDKFTRYLYFLNTSFTEQVLGPLLIFPGESFLVEMELWTLVYLLCTNNLTWVEQFK